MVYERIKKKCGQDFLIEASISAYEPEGGNTLEDTLTFAKKAEGYLDMIQVSGPIKILKTISFTRSKEPI